jgi:serine/threonine-protein kinase
MPSARKCVIKLLKPLVEDPEVPQWLKERFQREAAILEDLGENHPQIPRLYAYFTEKNNFYLVQEWVEGFTLTQKHEQQGNFSSEQIQELLIGLLPVLAFIHERRIIHRDIKPDNIILRTSDGKPVLIDFGIIKEAMGTVVNPDGRSAYSIALGTPGYMSSEQAAGRPVYSSDLYSLGLTAIFLLTGKTPQYLESDPRTGEILWRKEAPQVSAQLANVLDKSIHFHPRDRFTSAEEMLMALVSRLPNKTQSSFQNSTEATVAVGSNPKRRSRPVTRPTIELEEEEEETEETGNPWIAWIVMPLIFLVIIVSGLAVGFLMAKKKRMQPPPPSPIESIQPTPSEPLPTPTPLVIPTIRPTPVPTPIPTPVPTPIPTPEVSPSPDPGVNPENPDNPIPPLTPIPDPTPSVQSTPIFVPTPVPSPKPSPISTPTPEIKPLPENVPPAPPIEEKPVN